MILVIKLHVNNNLWAEELASVLCSSQNRGLTGSDSVAVGIC